MYSRIHLYGRNSLAPKRVPCEYPEIRMHLVEIVPQLIIEIRACMFSLNCVKGVSRIKQGEKTGITATGVLLLTKEKGSEREDFEEEAAFRSRRSSVKSRGDGKMTLCLHLLSLTNS